MFSYTLSNTTVELSGFFFSSPVGYTIRNGEIDTSSSVDIYENRFFINRHKGNIKINTSKNENINIRYKSLQPLPTTIFNSRKLDGGCY